MLRQLAQYHAKDPNNLFMVRLAQVKNRSLLFLVWLQQYLLGRRTAWEGREYFFPSFDFSTSVCFAGSDTFREGHSDPLSLPQ